MRKEERKENKEEKTKTLRRIDPLVEALFSPALGGNTANAAIGVEVVWWPSGGKGMGKEERKEKRRKNKDPTLN